MRRSLLEGVDRIDFHGYLHTPSAFPTRAPEPGNFNLPQIDRIYKNITESSPAVQRRDADITIVSNPMAPKVLFGGMKRCHPAGNRSTFCGE
jgi:hypothetical protein